VIRFDGLFETCAGDANPFDEEMPTYESIGLRGDMDEKLTALFQQWLVAFEAVQMASDDEAIAKAHNALSEIETRVAMTPAEGFRGLVVKLGLHCFLNDHADAASTQSESAYRDLVRLTGDDPAVAIVALFERSAA
jgi:hypothetical protein